MNRHESGSLVDLRFMIGDESSMIVPSTVVEDSESQLVLYNGRGMPYLMRRQPTGEKLPRVLSMADFCAMAPPFMPATHRRSGLSIMPKGAAHATRVRFDPQRDWAFVGWYVNLQTPMRRTADGLEITDQFLDILVDPDGRWEWKDEDELVLAVGRGRITAAEATAVREEGERVIARIEDRQFPFDRSLDRWRPDPAWPFPSLPTVR